VSWFLRFLDHSKRGMYHWLISRCVIAREKSRTVELDSHRLFEPPFTSNELGWLLLPPSTSRSKRLRKTWKILIWIQIAMVRWNLGGVGVRSQRKLCKKELQKRQVQGLCMRRCSFATWRTSKHDSQFTWYSQPDVGRGEVQADFLLWIEREKGERMIMNFQLAPLSQKGWIDA